MPWLLPITALLELAYTLVSKALTLVGYNPWVVGRHRPHPCLSDQQWRRRVLLAAICSRRGYTACTLGANSAAGQARRTEDDALLQLR